MENYVHINELEKAYWAGIFDGEGSMVIAQRSAYARSLQVHISQKNYPFLCRLKELYGGGVYKNTNNCWQWQLYDAEKIIIFLSSLLPYIKLRREEAEIAIQYCALVAYKKQTTPTKKLTEKEELARTYLEQKFDEASLLRRTAFWEKTE